MKTQLLSKELIFKLKKEDEQALAERRREALNDE